MMEGGQPKSDFWWSRGGESRPNPKKHDIINEQPLIMDIKYIDKIKINEISIHALLFVNRVFKV